MVIHGDKGKFQYRLNNLFAIYFESYFCLPWPEAW